MRVKITNFTGNHKCDQLFVTTNLSQPYGKEVEISLGLINRFLRVKLDMQVIQKELREVSGIALGEVPF